MSASIGTLTWDLVANLQRIQSDTESIRKMFGTSMSSVQGAVDLAKKALVGFAGAASIAGFAELIKGAIDSAEALHDLSIRTGASVESLSALASVGKTSGTSTDMIAQAMNRMAKGLAVANEESKGAAQALAALGINFDDFQKLSPDQKMVAVAKAMDNFADGSGKSAAAMALFGRSGAELLPFLKDLAETGELQAKVTTEQAARADQFNDNLVKLQASGGAWKRELAMGMVPALADASQAVLEVMNGAGGLRDTIRRLAADGTIEEWTRGAVTGLSYVTDAFEGVWRLIKSVGEILGAWAARIVEVFSGVGDAVSKLKSGDISGAIDAMSAGMSRAKNVGDELDKTLDSLWSEQTLGQKLRGRMDDIQKLAKAHEAAKPQVDLHVPLDANESSAKKAKTAFDSLVKTLSDHVTQTMAEVAQHKNLSEAQKLVLRAQEFLNDSTMKLTIEQRRQIEALIDSVTATDQQRQAQIRAKEAYDAMVKSVTESITSLEDQIAKQEEANVKAQLGAAAAEKLEIAKLNEAAATARQNAMNAAAAGLNQQLIDLYEKQAADLDKLAQLKEEGVHIQMAKQANEEWKKVTDQIDQGLTDALFRAAESGKGFFTSMRDSIKGVFNNLVLRPVIQAVMAPVAGAIGSILGTIGLGGGTVAGGSGAGGILGSLSNLSSLGSLFKGGIGGTLSGLGSSLASYAGQGIYHLGSAMGSSGMMNFGTDMALNVAGTTGGSIASMAATAMPMVAAAVASIALSKAVANGYSVGGFVGKALNFGGVIGGLINRAFGRRPRESTGTGLEGDFSATGFDGQQWATWKEQGGWLRSTKRGTDWSPIDSDMGAALNQSASAIYSQVAGYAKALQLPVDALKSITSHALITFGADEKQTQAAIDKAVGEYQNKLTASFSETLAPFQQAGETLLETMSRLAGIQKFSESLNDFGGIFSKVAQLSISAKEELLGFAGGIDAFVAKTKSFVDNYYSDGEKFGLAAKQLEAQLQAIGVTGDISSKADFRKLVEGTDISTTAGRQQLNSLLDLAQTFAPIGDYLEKQGGSLQSLASQAPQSALLDSVLNDKEAQQAYQDRLTGQVDQLNGSIESIGDQIAKAIADGNMDLLNSLATANGTLAQMYRQFVRWDNNGQLSTTTAAP